MRSGFVHAPRWLTQWVVCLLLISRHLFFVAIISPCFAVSMFLPDLHAAMALSRQTEAEHPPVKWRSGYEDT